MARIFVVAAGLAALVCTVGCSAKRPTDAQLRELQTHTYATTDQKLVMKAVINVLSDRGYVIDNTSLDLGQITATKREATVPTALNALTGVQYTAVIQCSVNVRAAGEQTLVRAVFEGQLLNAIGGVTKTEHGNDPEEHAELYQKFFADVGSALASQTS